MFASKVDDLHTRYIENLQKALDLERKISTDQTTLADASIARQLATEFKRHLKQTESHLTRLENLLRHSSGEAA